MTTPRARQAAAVACITARFPAWNPQARLALVTVSSTARSDAVSVSPSARSALRSTAVEAPAITAPVLNSPRPGCLRTPLGPAPAEAGPLGPAPPPAGSGAANL